MIKLSKVMLAVSLLISQASVLKGNYGADFRPLIGAVFGAGVVTGCLGLAKTIQVARGPQGTQKQVAQGTLITAGVVALVAIGYGAAKLK